jgi:biopolymer transport protein ExbB
MNLIFILAASPAASHLVDFKKIVGAAPVIYGLLSLMSIASMAIWFYSLTRFRSKDIMPAPFLKEIRSLLETGQYDSARLFCEKSPNLLSSLIGAGLASRKFGPQMMIDAMKSEGKRASSAFWQRLSLLNDVVIIAPMLGLLGTVIGMFYAFYDVNRSIESINSLFDGLGIAVGTTVAGLIVSILAMIFYTTLRYRVVKTLSLVENKALHFSALIDAEQKEKLPWS